MKKTCLQFLVCMIAIALFPGCGVKRPSPLFEASNLSAKLKSGDYVQKVDNFLILFDASHTMQDYYNGEQKFYWAQAAAYSLKDTIAGLKLIGGLRLFGNLRVFSANTSRVCPLQDYSAGEFDECLNKLNPSFGSTPMYEALEAAAGDIENLQGKTAVIIISDGLYTTAPPTDAVKILKDKYGDNVCVSAITIGSGGNMSALAADSKCGVAVSFDQVNTVDGMTDFAEQVFLEKKPSPPEPAPVPLAKEEKIILSSIMFDFDSSVIKTEYAAVLETTADLLKQKADSKIVIEGHTCSIGTPEYNKGLSERRAAAVKDFLVAQGIDSSRLTATGIGEEQPIADNTTKDGRKRNRRVEFHVTR